MLHASACRSDLFLVDVPGMCLTVCMVLRALVVVKYAVSMKCLDATGFWLVRLRSTYARVDRLLVFYDLWLCVQSVRCSCVGCFRHSKSLRS